MLTGPQLSESVPDVERLLVVHRLISISGFIEGVELVKRLSGISMLIAGDGDKVMLDCSRGLRFLVK